MHDREDLPIVVVSGHFPTLYEVQSLLEMETDNRKNAALGSRTPQGER